jgi:hypothetical protein
MATGFVQRFKGKITADALWYKGWNFDVSTPAAASTASAFQILNVISATGADVRTLQAPKSGIKEVIAITQVSSATFIKAAAGTNFGLMGTSTMIVMKSTIQMTVALVGLSSIQWAVESVWSTSTTAIPQPTWSTTT